MSNVAEVKQQAQKTQIVTVSDFMEKQKDLIAQVLPKTITPERLIGIFNMILKSSPKIAQCTQTSLIGAVIQVAQLGLQPGNMGHVHLIPFNNKGIMEVQLVIGYKGFVELVNRSGQATVLTSEVVHEKDQFHYELGLNPILKHIPATGDRGPKIGVYCVAKNLIAGEKVFVYLQKEEVEKIRAASKSQASEYSPWNTWPEEMYKKSAVKRITKLLPLSSESQLAIAADETIKTKIDKDMVTAPDETKWDAQDAEVLPNTPENGSELDKTPPKTEVQQSSQKDTTKNEHPVKGNLGQIPVNSSMLEFKAMVNSWTTRKTKTGKDITAYAVEDTDGTQYTIERWGTVHTGMEEGSLATFFEIQVKEFQGNRQYMAKEIKLDA